MNKRSWFHYRMRYLKAPDDGGAGGGVPPSGSDGGSPPVGGDGGGGSSVATPSSDGGGGSPSTPPSPDTSDPWGPLGSVEDLDHVEIPPQAPPVAPQPQTPQPQVPPPAQPQQPAPSPQVPQQPTPQAPQPQTTPAPAQSAPSVDLSPSDPAGMAAAMEENAPALIQHLAQQRFALTPEEVQELETDVTVAVPKLLAKVHLHSQIAMQKFLAQAVPGMIQRHSTVSRANDEAENKFFDTHKQLGLDKTNAQHRQVAVRTARLYRQMYPQASLDQLISDIGPMVARSLNLNGVTPQPQAQGLPPGTVMAQGVPFRPAVNGGGAPPVPSATPVDDNPWGGMGRDYD